MKLYIVSLLSLFVCSAMGSDWARRDSKKPETSYDLGLTGPLMPKDIIEEAQKNRLKTSGDFLRRSGDNIYPPKENQHQLKIKQADHKRNTSDEKMMDAYLAFLYQNRNQRLINDYN